MDDDRPDREAEPEPEETGWLPLVAGVLGLAAGAALGALVGLKDDSDAGLKLAAIGGFMGMVLAFVPVQSWSRSRHTTDRRAGRPDQPGSARPSLLGLHDRRGSRTGATVPAGGLPTRSVANRNADITGKIDGGTVVRVVRRSGNWARIHTGDDEEPIWLDGRRLEPVTSPPR